MNTGAIRLGDMFSRGWLWDVEPGGVAVLRSDAKLSCDARYSRMSEAQLRALKLYAPNPKGRLAFPPLVPEGRA